MGSPEAPEVDLRGLIREIPDFPRQGIGFKDIITFQFAAAFSAFGCTTADFMRRHSVSTQHDIGARALGRAP